MRTTFKVKRCFYKLSKRVRYFNTVKNWKKKEHTSLNEGEVNSRSPCLVLCVARRHKRIESQEWHYSLVLKKVKV